VTLVERLGRAPRDCRGATAVEFAFILPVFAMLTLGTISAAQLASVVSSMNYAVEEAARCFAVNKTVCGSSATTVTYAKGKYLGPSAMPAFVANTTGCGFTVTATATFKLEIAVSSIDVPLAAAACYPGKV
jgi:Flp pilus assembly protein TadG